MGEEEYFVQFYYGGDCQLAAVRVRVDLVPITDMNRSLPVLLMDHPLYRDLKEYVIENLTPGERHAIAEKAPAFW
jgi:hypothetical protein